MEPIKPNAESVAAARALSTAATPADKSKAAMELFTAAYKQGFADCIARIRKGATHD